MGAAVTAKITTAEMEVRVANYLNTRRNLIVPNVSWGMNVHECDLLVLTNAGWLWEVEIKISKADLKKDLQKYHRHDSPLIKRLYFAIPDYLQDCIELVPDRAGIIVVNTEAGRSWRGVWKHREARNHGGRKMTDAERYRLARLGALRIWSLKRKLNDCHRQSD